MCNVCSSFPIPQLQPSGPGLPPFLTTITSYFFGCNTRAPCNANDLYLIYLNGINTNTINKL